MKKELYLTVIITEKELKLYQQSKNIDSVTILSLQYHNYLNIFFKIKADILFLHWVYNHAIHFKKNAQFSVSALYDISCDETLKLCWYLNENLSKRFIWVSCLQTAVPVLFIKKPKEELCFYVNYKGLNIITVKNHYSLSLISEILNYLNYVKIFMKLDIISAFNKL